MIVMTVREKNHTPQSPFTSCSIGSSVFSAICTSSSDSRFFSPEICGASMRFSISNVDRIRGHTGHCKSLEKTRSEPSHTARHPPGWVAPRSPIYTQSFSTPFSSRAPVRHTVALHHIGNPQSRQVQNCGREIHAAHQRVTHLIWFDAIGPSHDERNAKRGRKGTPLAAKVALIGFAVTAQLIAVIAYIDHDRIVCNSQFLQASHHTSDLHIHRRYLTVIHLVKPPKLAFPYLRTAPSRRLAVQRYRDRTYPDTSAGTVRACAAGHIPNSRARDDRRRDFVLQSPEPYPYATSAPSRSLRFALYRDSRCSPRLQKTRALSGTRAIPAIPLAWDQTQ